ncbi:MAG: hypothetical protein FWE74_03000 [Oscillospiraceae bacterium]|nr:hypothetical protein [Oscillospiraceae bacterium]
MNAAVDASLAAPAKARSKYFEKIEVLETQKADIEHNLVTLRIASKQQYTESEIISWLKSFCNGDIEDKAFQGRIIDVLVNSVFVYDDKFVIYYNIEGSKQVSHVGMCEDLKSLESVESGVESNFINDKQKNRRVRISNTPLHKQAYRLNLQACFLL